MVFLVKTSFGDPRILIYLPFCLFTSIYLSNLVPDKGGIHIFFFFLNENLCYGYSAEAPLIGVSNEYHNICCSGDIRKISTFLLKHYENTPIQIENFSSKN